MGNRTIKTIAIAAAISVAVAVVVAMQLLPRERGGGGALIGGPFTLVDQHGRTRGNADFRGEFTLIYFGYTYCPDVCPTALHQMTLALDELGGKAKAIRPIFITVDPERDTVARLKEYAANFHPRLVALTGDIEAVKQAAKAYRVYFAKAKGSDAGKGAGKDYLMDHTSIIYLMDRDGRYLAHFNHQTDPSKMAAQIRDRLR